jgi:hypothetical protein
VTLPSPSLVRLRGRREKSRISTAIAAIAPGLIQVLWRSRLLQAKVQGSQPCGPLTPFAAGR